MGIKKLFNKLRKRKKDDLPVVINDYMTSDQISKMKRSDWGILTKESLINAVNFIPYAGGALAAEIATVKTFREANFFRKFLSFVYEIKDTSKEEREEFMSEIEDSAQDFSGNIITDIIDRTDNINKSGLLANITKAKINSDITIEDFFRLTNVIERIPYTDFKYLKAFETETHIPGGITELLYSTGAIRLSKLSGGDGNNEYCLTEIGEKLLRYGLKENVSHLENNGTSIPTMYVDDINEMLNAQGFGDVDGGKYGDEIKS